MSKEKAIEIVKNLTQTINKIVPSKHLAHKNETYEIPRARKSALIKVKQKLIKKYNLK